MGKILRDCPVCGSSKIQEEYTLCDYWLNDLRRTYRYNKCRDCGLIFANEPFSEAGLDDYYNSTTVYNTTSDSGQSPLIPKDVGMKRRSRVITQLKQSGRLLDVGCGRGEFIVFMRDKLGWNVSGIEVNQSQVDALSKQFGLDVRLGNVGSAGYIDGEFDVITLWDVIEHLPEPRNELMQIHKILKMDGLLVLRFPNTKSWDAILFKKYWAGLDAPRHIFAFSLANLGRLLEQTGFRITKVNSRLGSYLNLVKSIEFFLNGIGFPLRGKHIVLKILRNQMVRMLMVPFTFIKDSFHKGTELTVTAIRIPSKESSDL